MAREVFIKGAQDCEWLRSTHLPKDAPAFKCAILQGNEDSPDRVELYSRDHVRALIAVYVMDTQHDGPMIRQTTN